MFVSHFQNKIKEATAAKSEGTDHFKAHHYLQAIQSYEKSLKLVQPHLYHGACESEFARTVELRVTLLFNIGLCYFNQKMLREAEQKFSQALAINPQYLKALYKRALTRQEGEDIEGALADVSQVYQAEHETRQFTQAFERISNKHKEYSRKEQEAKRKITEKIKVPEVIKPKIPQTSDSKQKEQKIQVDDNKGTKKWFILPLVLIAGIGIYQHFKNSRRE